MSQPQIAASFSKNIVYSGAVIASGVANAALTDGAHELELVKQETGCAVVLLKSFRDKASGNPKADLNTAFDHIDTALAHNRFLHGAAIASDPGDQMKLHLSMQYFQAVLSDIPQISFLNSRMIDSFLEIKDALIETRDMLVEERI